MPHYRLPRLFRNGSPSGALPACKPLERYLWFYFAASTKGLICSTNFSGDTSGKPSHCFNTLPLSSTSNVNGNLPSALYLSAKASFFLVCSLLNWFFFWRGKSARTSTRCAEAKFSKVLVSSISLRSLIQGPHQSEPEKFININLCVFVASASASWKSPSQVTCGRKNEKRIITISFISIQIKYFAQCITQNRLGTGSI